MKGLLTIIVLGMAISTFAFNPFRVHTIGIDAAVYAQENNSGSIGIFAQKWLLWGSGGISTGDAFLGAYGELGVILPITNSVIIIPTGRLILGGQQNKNESIEYNFRSGFGIAFEIYTRWGRIIPGIELRNLPNSGFVIGGRLGVPF